ncbi:histone-lysine N-methyltransferase EZA1-like protein [Corchorus olitorius]|uniref:Histone-lysine N-methyltransferase EZA1-like protein n=1 Tax=Corchorus olitorius TaxID=93759 RepID=A0A1R3I3N7_9ROSI|nr:histone-lysine N-methyltransferase EZA1-like protein [Corchorus olitorius]
MTLHCPSMFNHLPYFLVKTLESTMETVGQLVERQGVINSIKRIFHF